jgi:hypothetical protein
MPHKWCEECKILLDDAANAISAHANAIARLEEAVRSNPEAALTAFESAVRATGRVREICVGQYEDHRAYHEVRAMAAGSSTFE